MKAIITFQRTQEIVDSTRNHGALDTGYQHVKTIPFDF